MTTGNTVIDAGEADFEAVVINASSDKLVVVDFWAEWCAPCRMLAPMLEKIVAEQGENCQLVKIDADKEAALTLKFAVRSLPTVKLFRNGEVVDEFVGVLSANVMSDRIATNMPT